MLLDAATFLGLLLAGAAIRTRRAPDPTPTAESTTRQSALTGLRTLRADLLLWPLLVGALVFIVVGETTNVVEVFFVRDTLHGSALAFGVIGALLAAGLVVGALAAGRATDDRARAGYVVTGAIGMAVSLVAASLAPNVVVFGICFALLGPFNGIATAGLGALLATRIPEAVLGQALAAAMALSRACGIGALLVGGAVASLAGPRTVFGVAGACGLPVALGMLVRMRRALRVQPELEVVAG